MNEFHEGEGVVERKDQGWGGWGNHFFVFSLILPLLTGFDLPRSPGAYSGAYAPRFCCGPLDFSDMGPKIVCTITRNPVFDRLF